jgi:hypothetical protein
VDHIFAIGQILEKCNMQQEDISLLFQTWKRPMPVYQENILVKYVKYKFWWEEAWFIVDIKT